MIKTKSMTTIEDVVVDIFCNQCGGTCMVGYGKTIDKRDFYGVAIDYTGGYYSKYLEDGNNYKFHLCEACLGKIIIGLQLHPTIEYKN